MGRTPGAGSGVAGNAGEGNGADGRGGSGDLGGGDRGALYGWLTPKGDGGVRRLVAALPLGLALVYGLAKEGDGVELYGLLDPDPDENVYWDRAFGENAGERKPGDREPERANAARQVER